MTRKRRSLPRPSALEVSPQVRLPLRGENDLLSGQFQPLVLLKGNFNGLLAHRIAGIYSGRRQYYSSAAAVCASFLLN
jgi:hypothetical protein